MEADLANMAARAAHDRDRLREQQAQEAAQILLANVADLADAQQRVTSAADAVTAQITPPYQLQVQQLTGASLETLLAPDPILLGHLTRFSENEEERMKLRRDIDKLVKPAGCRTRVLVQGR